MSRAQVTTCDGCGKTDARSASTRSLHGWRRVTVHWVDDVGRTQHQCYDACPDPICGARVVDATREDRPLRLVR